MSAEMYMQRIVLRPSKGVEVRTRLYNPIRNASKEGRVCTRRFKKVKADHVSQWNEPNRSEIRTIFYARKQTFFREGAIGHDEDTVKTSRLVWLAWLDAQGPDVIVYKKIAT